LRWLRRVPPGATTGGMPLGAADADADADPTLDTVAPKGRPVETGHGVGAHHSTQQHKLAHQVQQWAQGGQGKAIPRLRLTNREKPADGARDPHINHCNHTAPPGPPDNPQPLHM
jgi:hypothetical protein